MDEEALKQGVPDPPSIDEFSNLEEDMTEDQESQVKNNVPREHEESCMTEDKEITTIWWRNIGSCTIWINQRLSWHGQKTLQELHQLHV